MKLIRNNNNPILKPTSNSWENKFVFNCGVFEFQGKIHLLYRAQGVDMISRLGIARMRTPWEVEERNPNPILVPDPENDYEKNGLEDPRVVKIGESYFIVYTAASRVDPVPDSKDLYERDGWRIRVSLVKTKNFKDFFGKKILLNDLNSKDGTFFPNKIDGKYYLLHRIFPNINLASSENLIDFKDHEIDVKPRPGFWDSKIIGAGGPPIKSPLGWINFYHGVDSSAVYRLGLLVLDLKDPSKVIARSDDPVLEPIMKYEKFGGVYDNVVFTCGVYETEKEYLVYYGGADAVIGLATISKNNVFGWMKSILK